MEQDTNLQTSQKLENNFFRKIASKFLGLIRIIAQAILYSVKELFTIIRSLSFKSLTFLIFILVLLFILVYFMGYNTGKNNADESLRKEVIELKETIQEIRNTLTR